MKLNPLNYRESAKKLNNMTFTDYYYRLMLLSRSVFRWKGLEKIGIDEKWIEKYLYFYGECVFFHHKTLGFMVAQCADFGTLNHYDEPTLIKPILNNYAGEPVRELTNYEDCILIKNNDIMLPTAPTIELFSLRLTEIQRAIDININAQKTPLLIKCSDNQKQSLKQVYSQWNGFEPVIYGDKNLDTSGVEALKTDAPIVFDKLQIQKHSIWNECMTFLGVNNANMDKRERLVDDEVQANNEQIALSAEVMLKARELACKQINELFGLNISVEIRKPEELIIEELEQSKEGVNNG